MLQGLSYADSQSTAKFLIVRYGARRETIVCLADQKPAVRTTATKGFFSTKGKNKKERWLQCWVTQWICASQHEGRRFESRPDLQ